MTDVSAIPPQRAFLRANTRQASLAFCGGMALGDETLKFTQHSLLFSSSSSFSPSAEVGGPTWIQSGQKGIYIRNIYIYIEREKGNNEGGGLPQMVIASKWQEPLPYLYIRTRYKSAENRFKSLYGWSTRTKNKNLEDTRQKKNTNNKDDSPTGEGHKSVSVVGTRKNAKANWQQSIKKAKKRRKHFLTTQSTV